MDLDKVNEIATIPVLEKAYDDLVHPSAESIGKTVSLVPRTVAIWLSSWNRWVVNREESIKLAIDAIESRVDKIPEEHLTEPPAHIAVPAIQQLAYCYDSEELRGMYANLLLSSMDDRTAEYVHPSFVQLLKEISPDEAKLLSTLAGSDDAEHASIPLVDLRIVSADECCKGVCEYPDQSLVYLGNLDRLGILKRCDYYADDVKATLERFESSEAIQNAKAKVELEDDKKFVFHRWSYQVTDFGANFIKTCVS